MKIHYIVILIAVLLVASFGSYLTAQGIPTWYDTLTLPGIAPAGGFIGAVWTTIFILSAIATILIWNRQDKLKHFGWVVALLVINAILNVAWSYVFFVQHLLGWAIVEMIVLNLTTLALIVMVWDKVRVAAYLFIPYFVWVSFATYLAYQIWILN